MTSNSPGHDEVERPDDAASEQATPEVEAYEDGGTVVLFDAGNPLAWLEASRAVSLSEIA